MTDLQLPINYLEHFSYLGIFTLLVLGGILSPISEEFVLLTVGYLIGIGILNKFIVLPISLAGVFIGDNILFSLSKRGSRYAKWLMKAISEERLMKYEKFMEDHHEKAIFLLRFVIGLRFLGPMLAGIAKVRETTFRLYDTLAILIYVPLLIFIGYYFNDQLDLLTSRIATLKHSLFVSLLIVGALVFSILVHRRVLKR